MTEEEKAAVASLNKRLQAKCACVLDANDEIIVDRMCLAHRIMIDDAVKAEQDRCCQLIYGHASSDNVAARTVKAIRKQTK